MVLDAPRHGVHHDDVAVGRHTIKMSDEAVVVQHEFVRYLGIAGIAKDVRCGVLVGGAEDLEALILLLPVETLEARKLRAAGPSGICPDLDDERLLPFQERVESETVTARRRKRKG